MRKSNFAVLGACFLWLWASGAREVKAEDVKSGHGAAFSVSGEVALASLMSLGDGQLKQMADLLHTFAITEAARSGKWERIRAGLEVVSERAVPALNWFALPDGSYWSVQNGKEPGNLSGRAYFPRALAGETVIGELVVSTATQRPVAIVAVPVEGTEGQVVGVLGASVYLDRLSRKIKQQLALGPESIFFSFDATRLVGLNWDPELIFLRPMESDEPQLSKAFGYMRERERGLVRYRFRGEMRSVLFRRSPVTGWWYAFGVREN